MFGIQKIIWNFTLSRSVVLISFFVGIFIVPMSHAATPAKALKQLAFQMSSEISVAGAGRKLALRPFIKGQTSLDPIAADRLYDSIYQAFIFVKEMGDFEFVDQRHIMEILSSREEFYMGNPEELLKKAQADIEIICHPTALVKQVRLSCTATDLHTATTYSTKEITLDFDVKAEGAVDYLAALEVLSQSIAPTLLNMKTMGAPAIIDMQTGSETEVSEMLGSRLTSNIVSIVSSRQAQAQQNYEANRSLNEAAIAPPPNENHITLHGKLRHLNENILELFVTFFTDDRLVASGTIRVLKKSLPKNLQITAQDQKLSKYYSAFGEAVISETLDAASARRAAINLARARIVAQALGRPSPAFSTIDSEANASLLLLNSMTDAIPAEERIFDTAPKGTGKRIAVEVHALVKRIGTSIAPNITAKLSHSSYGAGQPIHMTIKSAGTANLAIFGWFADGQIVRVYPKLGESSLGIKKNHPLILPRENDNPFMSAPMPISGNLEDQEAFIILAHARAVDFKELAPLLGDSMTQTIATATNSSDFFTKLSRMDLSKMSMTILPYQVHQ